MNSQTKKTTVGLPRMHKEEGERRDFLPKFAGILEKYGAQPILEDGYGRRMGLNQTDYRASAPSARFVTHREAYRQDIVVVLRCPGEEQMRWMRPGCLLVSMLHFGTRPKRVELLRELGLNALSIDGIVDDYGHRLVENLSAVAWNGMEAAFQVLEDTYPPPGLRSPRRPPIYITLLGAGAVGGHTVQAAVRYGNPHLQAELAKKHVPGVIVTAVDRDITGKQSIMQDILSRTDMLVDASARRDQTQPIIPNDWLAYLPIHAVILDLSVDPYEEVDGRLLVKGIEGIPQGNLNQYIFTPDDPAYDLIPDFVSTKYRRHAVSCYSWPGIEPFGSMHVYGEQLRPIMRIILEKGGVENMDKNGSYFERAISRSLLSNWPD